MVWKKDAPMTLELNLGAGADGSRRSLAPKPLLLLLRKFTCELSNFRLQSLGFLTLKYVLSIYPVKVSPSPLETQCLYKFSLLCSRNSSPASLPALSEPFLLTVLHTRHTLHVVLMAGPLGGQQEHQSQH